MEKVVERNIIGKEALEQACLQNERSEMILQNNLMKLSFHGHTDALKHFSQLEKR